MLCQGGLQVGEETDGKQRTIPARYNYSINYNNYVKQPNKQTIGLLRYYRLQCESYIIIIDYIGLEQENLGTNSFDI